MTTTTAASALQAFRRSAWFPITTEGDGTRDASKFAGIPWLAEDEDWPMCPNCQQPMQLFVQLNLSTLPAELEERFGPGLLQLFYCTTDNDEMMCDCDYEGWEPFSTVHVTRIIQPEGKPGSPTVTSQSSFPAQQITGWQVTHDYPGYAEAQEPPMDLNLSVDGWDAIEAETGQEVPLPGDKLAGWPAWVQGVEYPHCPTCGERMALVFQLDSEDHLPYMFGDMGCGHITQCPTHKDQLGFGWACG